MTILVTYRCTGCDTVDDQWVQSPPPSVAPCTSCGGPARRRYAFGIIGRAQAPEKAEPRTATSQCRANPDVPLLCHVDPAAAPAWVARFRGDQRALERHTEAAANTPVAPRPEASAHRHHHHHRHHGQDHDRTSEPER